MVIKKMDLNMEECYRNKVRSVRSKNIIFVVLFLAIAGIVFMGWGAYLKESSPNFDAWLHDSAGDMDPGLGAVFASWWGFDVIVIGISYFTLFVFYQVTSLSYKALAVNHHLIAGIIKYVFILLMVLAVIVSWAGVVSDIRWGFYIYALGEILISFSLAAVIIKTITALKDKA